MAACYAVNAANAMSATASAYSIRSANASGTAATVNEIAATLMNTFEPTCPSSP